VMSRWNVCARSAQAGALLAAVVLCVTAASAAPEAPKVRVTDAGSGQLVIEARDATVQQVLEALGQTHTIQFQDSEALSRHITGTYSGTLRRVLSRILDGYDHVIRSTSSGIQIDVVGAAKSGNVTASAGPTMTVSAARSGPRVAPRVSGNVDADEAAAQGTPAPPPGPPIVNLASGSHPGAPSAIQPSRAGLIGGALHPRVSGNVDADEERAQ
jgi:hypothetical protein